MTGPLEDYYALLGVARAVSATELRRAYHRLALRYHPDRAGPEGTTLFQRISMAYEVLSDAQARADYDGRLRAAEERRAALHETVSVRRDPRAGGGRAWDGGPAVPEHGEYVGHGGRFGVRARRERADDLIDRLCGPLESLLARAAARRCPDGGLELHVTRVEAEVGGTAAIDATLEITCPTCLGLAERHRVWCRRCEYAGTVADSVTIGVCIPPLVRDGTAFLVQVDPLGAVPPLRVRVRVI